MASTLLDIVIMTPSSAFGTSSTIPLGSAATVSGVGYLSFAAAGATSSQQVSYSILDTGNSEIGTATYTSSNTTLTNRTPTKSTNAGAAIAATSAALIIATVRGEDLNSFIVAGQLLATATNDSASAGNVGEFFSATVSAGTPVALTTGTAANVTQIALTAGDFDADGTVGYVAGGAATLSATLCWISSQSAVLPTVPNFGAYNQWSLPFPIGTGPVMPTGTRRISEASSSIYYLGTLATFSSGVSAFGFIGVRRAR